MARSRRRRGLRMKTRAAPDKVVQAFTDLLEEAGLFKEAVGSVRDREGYNRAR